MIIGIAEKEIEVQEDTARRVELDTREVPADRVPGYDDSASVKVTPRLDVRNYGRMQIHDARDEAWESK